MTTMKKIFSMRKIKFLLATIMMLVGITAQADPITITWTASAITGYRSNPITIEGVTLTAGNIQDWNMPMIKGGGTFTTTLGNFTKIELNADWITDFSGTGWVKNGWQSQTWTGDAASVSYSGTIGGGGMTCDGGSMTITFTIEKPTVAVTGVTLSQTEATLNIGETLTLTATVAPDNATDQTVTWTSSDETVATVADGVVTAVAVGTATITVTTTDGAKTATCAVTVAATAPEVAWDKAEKSGSFTMPGGNVTLEPEYYPQATLAFQGLTATVDAAAKTEAPLAVLADGAVTGGTLMYYVATDKNFSQADAIALAETQWSAAIPTAETIEAAGTYIMWYYIKGDAEHSDTDPVPLAVTLLPEPTYAVTFAEGTPETDKWTASPNTGVTKGQTVNVTYTGSKKVIGVKAEKKAKPAGPITVTWNPSDIVPKSPSDHSFTKDGITFTAATCDFQKLTFGGGGTFTTTIGNFTKIEISADFTGDVSGTGWSNDGWQSATWTGNAASVSFSGDIWGGGMTCEGGNLKIVFTIE